MKIVIYWRKEKIIDHEVWQFWSGGHNFSCSLSSIHKRRRPIRIFLEFAYYRPLNKYEYKEMGEFGVEERERYIKIINHGSKSKSSDLEDRTGTLLT